MEWLTDEQGKRYRMVGKCKEYETIISTSFGDIPESQLEERTKAMQESTQRYYEALRRKQAEPKRSCPFVEALDNSCKKDDCAMYQDNKCGLLQTGFKSGSNTKSKFCPLSKGRCTDTCTFYNDGCLVPDIAKGVSNNEEL